MTSLPMKLLAGCVVLAGCASIDPLTRPGEWHPVSANDRNLRAMIAEPRDLVSGRATQVADGAVAGDAVARYRAGKVHALIDASVSKVAPLAMGAGGLGPVEGN